MVPSRTVRCLQWGVICMALATIGGSTNALFLPPVIVQVLEGNGVVLWPIGSVDPLTSALCGPGGLHTGIPVHVRASVTYLGADGNLVLNFDDIQGGGSCVGARECLIYGYAYNETAPIDCTTGSGYITLTRVGGGYDLSYETSTVDLQGVETVSAFLVKVAW